ncbi:SDR family NAD(P)-dependent oxidoreductase [Streptacidiphilus jiangxiensis]|uniref:3alpha(Or 20beta)-hydroxysteroid dehydrogenase n=1 Tax=Streptacidiphilus jiangxiensis TaxID=235985 RepID=A0A1H7LZM7_STRJI|nr:SDR family oxidoreductase [Streptacidiphilus jiangxiensis]SEL04423.1 3alpha(or 20beta)-hydroxysteroid dehydrogenase [Streptacidiphilus jiangxiensis]
MTQPAVTEPAGRLSGRTVLITGAARGQGEAEARLFAAEGAQVLLGDVLDDRGEALAKELQLELGADRVRYQHLDVGSEEGWAAAVETAVAAFGKLDGLLNNAGILRFNELTSTPLEEYLAVVRVNQVGCFLGMRAAAPAIEAAGGGTIVNTASYTALTGMALLTSYAATKGAIVAMTRVAALELAPKGIRVNAICPGAVDTPMSDPANAFAGADGAPVLSAEDAAALASATAELYGKAVPLGRIGRPEEMARLALFLTSADSSYITGQPLVADGGWMSGVSIG